MPVRTLVAVAILALAVAALFLPTEAARARSEVGKATPAPYIRTPTPLLKPLKVPRGNAWSPVRKHARKGLPFTMHEVRHRNGLTVIAVPMPTPGVVGYGTLVRVGARNEVERGLTGFAHFFEHMMFRGTRRYPPAKYKAALQSLGSNDNAYTNKDRTFYYIVARADGLEKIIEIESDRFQRLKYAKAGFQTEARAVLGEYRKSTTNPWYKAWEKIHGAAFKRHTYSHITIGFLKDIQAMPRRYAYSLKFFRRYYTPDNCMVIVTGDVKLERLKGLIDKYYGKWRGRVYKPRVRVEPRQTKPREVHVDWPRKTVPRLIYGYKAPAFLQAFDDSAALTVLAELTFGKASPLYRDLVLKRQLASSIEADAAPSRDPHLFLVYAELKKKENEKAVRAAITARLARLASGKVDPIRVAAVRSHIKYNLLLQLNTPRSVLFTLARLLSPRGSAGDLTTYLGQLDKVSARDVARVAKHYLQPSRATYLTLYQGGAK